LSPYPEFFFRKWLGNTVSLIGCAGTQQIEQIELQFVADSGVASVRELTLAECSQLG